MALDVVFFGTFYDFVPSLSRKNEEINIKDEGIRKKKKIAKDLRILADVEVRSVKKLKPLNTDMDGTNNNTIQA